MWKDMAVSEKAKENVVEKDEDDNAALLAKLLANPETAALIKALLLLSGLQLSGKLNSYLANIDKQTEDMCSRLVKQIATAEGITEQLKADNQMEWVAQMNNIRSRATEIVNVDFIFS